MENHTTPQTDLLTDVRYNLIQASSGKRFVNLLIDSVISGVLYNFIEDFFLQYLSCTMVTVICLYPFSFSIAFSLMYMFLNEYLLKGKSVGKFITGTRAVTQDGKLLTAKDALMRSLVRLIPFEAFSALGSPCYPWHDKWTNTYVIDEKQSDYEIA